AYLIYGLLIVSVIYIILHYYLKRQQLLHQMALEQVEYDKLEELDSMKSRFFANISHEFRTPLTLILGPLEKLRSKISDKDSEQDLNMMQRNASRLQNLINQLLSLSKLESGKMKMQAIEMNIVSLVKEYVQSFESLAKQKKIEYLFNSSEENISLFIDKDKIEKILYNLLSNAFKFTGEGGRIEVTITPLPPSRGDIQPSIFSPLKGGQRGVNISISDTGRGIPPEKLDHIFDRFYQVDDSYTKDQEGTGIGLALTKELVEIHHGEIIVESESGKGTTFTVFLQVGKDHLKPEEIGDSTESVKTVEMVVREDSFGESVEQVEHFTEPQIQEDISDGNSDEEDSKQLLLIVEDNDDLRSYIRSYLMADYRISEAINGEMGMVKAIEKIPDLVISDVMMPKMDGMELSRKLKTDERTSHIPIILLTAKAAMEDKLEGLEAGADDFLTKPFDPDELQVRIKNLIKQREKLKEGHLNRFKLSEDKETERVLSMDDQFLLKAKSTVEQFLSDSEFNVEYCAKELAMSRVQLHRKLRALLNQSSSEFIRTIRLNKAAIMLLNKSANVSEICYDVGFTNPAYFTSCFRKKFGQTPTEYANQNSMH
ncbi:MAG: response regulator, partial [Bacteroidales bacterium]|nr:response regulator [Bacteroidales bacterium]